MQALSSHRLDDDVGDGLWSRRAHAHQAADERRHVDVVLVVGLGELILRAIALRGVANLFESVRSTNPGCTKATRMFQGRADLSLWGGPLTLNESFSGRFSWAGWSYFWFWWA